MRVYNTLTGKKEDFKPREKGKISMYVCGPTVYNYIHIGNARAYIAFDAIFRFLLFKGYEVNYVRNLTDVDDKIIKRAAEENATPEKIAEKYTKAFHKDMKILGVEKPTVEPKATEHINDMIKVVEKLIENGLAYVVDGDVYYSVKAFKGYGKLSKRSLDEMIAGSRVEVDPRKKHPMDFALWKKAKEGEPAWPSPWGDGRPGWHIECSTMSMQYLKFGFDIHGGGQDLIFPHHENEIAQAEGYCGKEPFVRYWLHNGFLNIEKEKMAKSVGNVILIKDLEEQYKGRLNDLRNDLRMLFLSTHYRSPLSYNDEKMEEAASANKRIIEVTERLEYVLSGQKEKDADTEKFNLSESANKTKNDFEAAMDDDFNTPIAISTIFNLIKEVNTLLDSEPKLNKENLKQLRVAYDAIVGSTELLGFSFKVKAEINLEGLKNAYKEISGKEATTDDREDLEKEILDIRTQSREKKDFEKADKIRDELRKIGLQIKDTPYGPRIST
ncbi:MAG: cysteine--tRNA ligase [Actinobacteria bacterium]|nr:MAG: cysteine--tRNA ligase [Actinomycetota bacterium]